jgi:hypothetical protein
MHGLHCPAASGEKKHVFSASTGSGKKKTRFLLSRMFRGRKRHKQYMPKKQQRTQRNCFVGFVEIN